MRGLVFTEFLDFVDQTAGPEMVEDMIAACDLASGGAYTTVGNYPHDEFLTMLAFLHRATGQNVSEMVMGFGENLFGPLIACHPKILHNGVGLLDFLESIETHIHHEVRKLNPAAELPHFTTKRLDQTRLRMDYRSARPFADLAEGMIKGAIAHFGLNARIDRAVTSPPDPFAARFDVVLLG